MILQPVSLNKRGFVLIELVVVVAIIALIFTGAIISLSGQEGGARKQVYQTDLGEIEALIVKAHTYAQAGRFNDDWGVRRLVETTSSCGSSAVVNCFVLFKGDDYATRDASYDEYVIYSSSLLSLSDDRNEDEIYFQRGTGWGRGFRNTINQETRFRFSTSDGSFACSIFVGVTGIVYTNCSASNYEYSKEITINAAEVSGSVVLVDFPVFFSETSNDFKTIYNGGHIQRSDGSDIRFVLASTGAQLPHELDTYDPTTGKLEAWVKIPSLSPDEDTVIRIDYGSDAVVFPNATDRTDVWDTGYVAVWHMSQDPSIRYDGFCRGDGASYYGCDSTNQNNFTVMLNTMTTSDVIVGKLGKAMDFDQWGDELDAADSTTLDAATGSGQPRTWSYWINLYSNASNRSITDKEDSFTGGGGFWSERTSDVISGGVSTSGALTSSSLGNSVWKYIVFTYDGSQARLYVDGALDDGPNSQTAPAANNYSFTVGGYAGAYAPYAKIDEVRISNVERGADWIATEFNNQNSTSTFYSITDEIFL